MKIYQYEPESGVYAGELFEDDGNIQYDEGVTMMSPPSYEAGQVPVFNMAQNKWELLPVEAVRQLLSIKSKGASR